MRTTLGKPVFTAVCTKWNALLRLSSNGCFRLNCLSDYSGCVACSIFREENLHILVPALNVNVEVPTGPLRSVTARPELQGFLDISRNQSSSMECGPDDRVLRHTKLRDHNNPFINRCGIRSRRHSSQLTRSRVVLACELNAEENTRFRPLVGDSEQCSLSAGYRKHLLSNLVHEREGKPLLSVVLQ
jgi:hypothetical protein